MDAKVILSAAATLIERAARAPGLPEPWPAVLTAIGAAAGLAAAIAERGLDPIAEITAMRSVLGPHADAQARLRHYVNDLATRGRQGGSK